MAPRANIFDYAQRATSFGLLGLGVWGLWLTAAVWKSRRGEQGLMAPPGTINDVKARQESDARRLQMEAQIRETQPTRPT